MKTIKTPVEVDPFVWKSLCSFAAETKQSIETEVQVALTAYVLIRKLNKDDQNMILDLIRKKAKII